MARARSLYSFYRSDEWKAFRQTVIAERTQADGFIYDEVTGKPILKPYDLILHHVEELTEENVNDANIALNPKNIQIVSHKTHNAIHDRFGKYETKKAYIVYGPPLAGKTTWVKENKGANDLVIDIDSIWQCLTAGKRYVKPRRLKGAVFRIRDELLDIAKHRLGFWNNVYIIGGYPFQGERERLAAETGAEEILIDTPKDECLRRLMADTERDQDEWTEYIEEWFRRYPPRAE